MNIVAFKRVPILNKRDLKERTYPYLLRGVNINRKNQVWGIDITYVLRLANRLYVSGSIIDWYTRLYIITIGSDPIKGWVTKRQPAFISWMI